MLVLLEQLSKFELVFNSCSRSNMVDLKIKSKTKTDHVCWHNWV